MYAKVVEGVVKTAAVELDGYIEVVELPEGKRFREAWVMDGDKVVVDLAKAKEVAHTLRRAARDAAYQKVDGGSQYIMVNEEGEAKRLEVKTPDDEAQVAIDACSTVEELTEIVNATYS